MNNKQRLTKEFIDLWKINRQGAKSTRTTYFNTMKLIINDLYKLGELPNKWHQLKDDAILLLIEHWKKQGKQVRTISNRISILRRYFSLAGIKYVLLDNKTLGLGFRRTIVKKDVTDKIIDSVYHDVTKTIMAFELYFGLTKMESIRIAVNKLTTTQLLVVHRSIAYNQKDRVIPIVMDCQRNAIEKRLNILAGNDSLRALAAEHIISSLYRSELILKGFQENPILRQHYANIRYNFLKSENNLAEKDVFAQVQHELGLSSPKALRVWLNE